MGKQKKVVESVYLNQLKDPNRFTKNPDGWIKDNLLDIEWGPTSKERMDLAKAKEFCKSHGGRLPTIDELHTLVDYSRRNPCTPEIFTDTRTDDWYRSSTPLAGTPSDVWCVGFGSGGVFYGGKSSFDFVRPVRASQ